MKRILMVDDVATNLRCATEVLKDQYDIMAVKSGEKAFEALESAVFDLVLLDINMPGMNGFEVFDRMKKIPAFSGIPVVFLTAAADKDIEARGREMGAVDFIRKPYEPDDLRSRIEKVLNNSIFAAAQTFEEDIEFLLYKKNKEKLSAWADSEKTKGYLLLLNFCNFRQIRGIFGTAAEKEILLKIMGFLKEISPDDICICHMEDDHFALYLESSQYPDTIRTVVRRIIAGLEFEINEAIPEEFGMKITVSAGIAAKPEDGENYTALLECADKALYFVKESGKRKYHFYSVKPGEQKEAAEESNSINLLQLKRQFDGKDMDSAQGWESLQKAYHIISKYWENSGEEMQIIFFNILGDHAEEKADLLSEVITGSLRKGDAAVKCGKSQYIAVLLNISVQNGEMAARRIKKKFEEKTGRAGTELAYEMRSI